MKPVLQFSTDSVSKKYKVKPKRVKGDGNQTFLGRFDAESFRDAMNNLPIVQDVVIDGIMDEMKTAEGRKKDSETVNQLFNI